VPTLKPGDILTYDPTGSNPKFVFPKGHGHPRFYELTRQEEELHSKKNKDYARGGDPLGNFNRVAEILKLYPGFPFDSPAGVALIYAFKQIDAAMWSMAKGYKPEVDPRGERFGDASIYFKLARIMDEILDENK